MSLQKSVYSRRHYTSGPWYRRKALCGAQPATLGPDPTNNPTRVTCQRCNMRLESVARSLGAFADALRVD